MQKFFMATTPWGSSIAGPFANKDAFYNAYPHLQGNWKWKEHPGKAPLGWDIHPKGPNGEDWLLTFCYTQTANMMMGPSKNTAGVVTAFDRDTGEIYVLDDPIDLAGVSTKYNVKI